MNKTFQHPLYNAADYLKWRLAYEGGRSFIDRYLRKYSLREDVQDYADRKQITYCPSFAKASINEIKNSIYQRMGEVSRIDGSENYRKRIAGEQGGVDNNGSNMISFMGQVVLPELLVMGKVGIYVDMPQIPKLSKRQAANVAPYVYMYPVETIKNWNNSTYSAVYLEDTVFESDELGFKTEEITRHRKLWQTDDGKVYAQFCDEDDKELEEPVHLENLSRIPFVMLELSESLMTDIADYQIALLNIASSDLAYNIKANFPFYVEQYDPRAEGSSHLNHANEGDDGVEEAQVGVIHGRKYSSGLDAPQFINRSSEPLIASMKKQEQLKAEIRLLLNLSLTNIKTVGAVSAESKKQDELSLESGLANIGLTLEKAEREVARIWAEYEGEKEPAIVSYPKTYSLKTTKEKTAEADTYRELLPVIPSKRYQQEIAKKIAKTLLGDTVGQDAMIMIEDEIDTAPALMCDPKVVNEDVKDGICSPETAAKLKGYPDDEPERAKAAHIERLARIAEAQSAAKGPTSKDSEVDGEYKDQKETSQNTDFDETTHKKTRGEA